ncbi:Hypothetical protein PHPALM_400 [Phytophthora palmivora]|uniref:Uncharacterized protein n=1 Tax=Phytophthora palmivora TaxID=4796 RepID=A0A2P4YV08_9STRA|nr:Hypothetical protein PHPALM_400 [Phytophthora palmivora]
MYYQIAIFNRMEMDIAVDSLAVGMSPRQVAWHLAALTRRTTGAGGAAPVFPLLKVEDIRELARLTVSTSMQLTGELLSRSWTFGLVLREVTMAPKAPHAAFLDVRVVVYANGKLRDVHIVALPLFERHKALTLAHSIESVLDAALPLWRIRVLGLTHNGHIIVLSTSPSVHRTAEVLALLETSIQTSTRALPNRELHKTWGACCQVSLALSTFYESLLGGDFLSALHALIAYIRREPALLREMGPPPSVLTKDNAGIDNLNASVDLHTDPELVTMGLDTQWITDKRVRLRKHLEQQLSSSTPAIYSGTTTLVNDVWWVVFFVVHWVATRANEAFEKLRSPRVSRSKQIQVIAAMSTELIATFTIQRGQLAESREIPLISRQNKFSVLKSNVHEFIDDQGIFVSNVAAKLEPAALDAVLENLAISLVDLAESLTDLNDILPESGESARLLPPVLPHELAQLNGREFTALLRRYCGQLNAFYSDEELDTLEQEHQALCRAATRETELKTSLAKCNGESPFTESWELTKSKFPLLQGFAGGLASAYTGRDVGCKKSLISFSIDACRETDIEDGGMGLSAIDFGLETTLHAWQFDALSRLSEACESTEAIAT